MTNICPVSGCTRKAQKRYKDKCQIHYKLSKVLLYFEEDDLIIFLRSIQSLKSENQGKITHSSSTTDDELQLYNRDFQNITASERKLKHLIDLINDIKENKRVEVKEFLDNLHNEQNRYSTAE